MEMLIKRFSNTSVGFFLIRYRTDDVQKFIIVEQMYLNSLLKYMSVQINIQDNERKKSKNPAVRSEIYR